MTNWVFGSKIPIRKSRGAPLEDDTPPVVTPPVVKPVPSPIPMNLKQASAATIASLPSDFAVLKDYGKVPSWGFLTSGKWDKLPSWQIQQNQQRADAQNALPQEVPLRWDNLLKIANAPSWWRGKIANKVDANTGYLMQMNAMIPYLSPEDQRSVATSLARQAPDVFGEYDPSVTQYPAPPPEMNTATRQRFTSTERTQEALKTLQNMASATGKGESAFGAGYTYLKTLLKTLQDFSGSGANQQTRAQAIQQASALGSVTGESTKYNMGGITQALTQPYFSSGQVAPIIKSSSGRYTFGTPNPLFY